VSIVDQERRRAYPSMRRDNLKTKHEIRNKPNTKFQIPNRAELRSPHVFRHFPAKLLRLFLVAVLADLKELEVQP
jgi:hypothetical protein